MIPTHGIDSPFSSLIPPYFYYTPRGAKCIDTKMQRPQRCGDMQRRVFSNSALTNIAEGVRFLPHQRRVQEGTRMDTSKMVTLSPRFRIVLINQVHRLRLHSPQPVHIPDNGRGFHQHRPPLVVFHLPCLARA